MTLACSWRSRLRRPVFLWWAAAFATQLVVHWLLKYAELSPPARLFLSFLPALMWIIVVVTFVQTIRKSDELRQRIHMQAVSIAAVPAAILILVFAGLERSGIYSASWSDVGSSMMLLLMVAYIFSAWRYR
jgi:Kef-type K+ transport system membrane component KefB